MREFIDKKTITFEDVEKRLKNIKLEEYTEQDIIDRYIAYGSDEELNRPSIQKNFIKYNLIDELTSLVESVIVDKYVIDKILTSDLFNSKNIIYKNGIIKNITIITDNKLSEEIFILNIIFFDIEAKQEIKLKDIYCKRVRKEEQDIDKLKNISEYKDKELTVIIENINNENRVKCFMKRYNI